MNIVIGVDERGNRSEIDLDKVRYFGSEIERTKRKDEGEGFKSFRSHCWVKETSQKVYLPEYKITDLKHYFQNYNSEKRYHTEEKKGKTKKATEWICEVVEEGTITFHGEKLKELVHANEHRRMFVYKNTEYFFIIPLLFRSNTTNEYMYFDESEGKLISLGFVVTDYPSKERLFQAIDEYEGGKN
jgi:hypothetical protein